MDTDREGDVARRADERAPGGCLSPGHSVPEWIVCPKCRGGLEPTEDGVRCQANAHSFPRVDGFLHLLADHGDRFHDARQEQRDLKEEDANTYTTLTYLFPVIRQLFGERVRASAAADRPRTLSNGCGVGVEVDLLADCGCDAYGIDCGERVWAWARRRHRDRLSVANAKALPFADDSFDFATTGCLLPHVGVVGDTTSVVPDYWEQRARVAKEMARVVRPGGYLLMASPNRVCPVDLGHLHRNPAALMRIHWPKEPFLLSLEDYRHLFVREAGCRSVQVMPLEGYFGFLQKSHHPWQRYLVPLIRLYFRLLFVVPWTRICAGGLNPWLIILVAR